MKRDAPDLEGVAREGGRGRAQDEEEGDREARGHEEHEHDVDHHRGRDVSSAGTDRPREAEEPHPVAHDDRLGDEEPETGQREEGSGDDAVHEVHARCRPPDLPPVSSRVTKTADPTCGVPYR